MAIARAVIGIAILFICGPGGVSYFPWIVFTYFSSSRTAWFA
jgi:hypothetical protein